MRSTETPIVRALPWLILAAIVLIGLSLRGPVVAVAPVAGLIGGELDLDSARVGLLTSLPLLCFAFATPLASLIIARAGRDLSASITLVGVVIGTLIRSSDGAAAAFVGTIVLGIFITVGNVVIPLVIADEIPSARSGMATGAYTASLNVGSVITTFGTAQIALALGWRVALAIWAGLAVVALVVWLAAVGPKAALTPRPRPQMDAAARAAAPPSVSFGIVLALGVAFGTQAFAFYGMSAWLPKLLTDEQGFSAQKAGSASAVFQLFGIAGALTLPLLVRWLGRRAGILTVLAFWLSVPLGLLIAPQAWPVWTITGGLAQGGGITMMFLLVVALSQGARGGRASATVQGVGYAIAATAPAALGALRDSTGAWTLSLVAVAVSVLIAAVFGLITVAGIAKTAGVRSDRVPG